MHPTCCSTDVKQSTLLGLLALIWGDIFAMSIHNQNRNHRWRHTALAVALRMSLGGVETAQSHTTRPIIGSAGPPGSPVPAHNAQPSISRDLPDTARPSC